MQLSTLDIARVDARKAFLEYRTAVQQQHHDQEDEMLMRAYRELSRGQQVIDLVATIRAGGLFPFTQSRDEWDLGKTVRRHAEYLVPRLAIARADARVCWIEGVDVTGTIRYHWYRESGSYRPRSMRNQLTVREVLPGVKVPDQRNGWLKAAVPQPPAVLRPGSKLVNYHVLWEADWRIVACGDPALLKHLGGNLYAVVTVWNLTELERTVLSGRSI